MPHRVRIWVLTGELAVLAGAAFAARVDGAVTVTHGVLCAVLVLTAVVHAYLTRPAEERRRGSGASAGGDQSAFWNVAAAALLPLVLVIPVFCVIRLMRYRIARRPPAKFAFTSAALGCSIVLEHLSGYGELFEHLHNPLQLGLHLGSAVLGYVTGQTLFIGIAKGLETQWAQRWRSFGDRAENLALASSTCVGLAFAAVLHASPLLGVLPLPAIIALTHLQHRYARMQAERDQLETDALHDPLTGLPNRRGFSPRAALALTTDQAEHRPTALLMLDVDHFKNWNTTLGHFGADLVLQRLAAILRSATRNADLLCRWGGEEIAIVLPDTDRTDAVHHAERIRTEIADARIATTLPHGGRTVTLGRDGWPAVTVSIGVATSPEHGAELTQVQQAADTALQRAKDTGRNRVTTARTTTHPVH